MSFLKKNIITLLLVAIVYVWFFLIKPINNPPSLNVLGADTSVTIYIQPESGEAPIVSAINDSKTEVLVEVYLLSDKAVINALEQAVKRGVAVKVMLEQHPFGGGGTNPKTKQELEAQGVSVEWSNPKFSLTHEKAIVIDGNKTFILSQNLTTSAFSKNREYDVLDLDPTDVSQVRQMFISDWQRSDFNPSSSHLLESPNTSRGAITQLINSAKSTIDIEIEDINDISIANTLCDKAKNTTVDVLTPSLSQLNSNKKTLSKLNACKVSVKTITSPYMHAKLILVDGVKAYVGSINLSAQSMDENRELGIMLSGSNDLTLLSSTFYSDWEKAIKYSAN